ncbi:BnaAnng28530D [Brassica napus]|uniref:BnaAnng28530D protein n=1 Tax=Brassica napus TaxID=3708 RepID=A0A078JTT7_BRANA|nr:BnaAnng28530D [Brassica napus]
MRCHEVKSWTFSGLVAAFLDLSVAFSLLCASSLVYLTSKLLGVFGLNLPCPCDGLFSDPPHKNKCFQETLVNLPVKKISSVQRSVISTTPFDSLPFNEANGGECGGKKRKGERSRHVEFEKEVVFRTPEAENASCFDLLTSQSLKKGTFKVKSKRLSFHRSPYGCQSKHSPQSPASVMEYLNDAEENHPLLVNSKDGGKDLEDVPLKKKRTLSWAGEGTCTSPVDLTQKPIEQVLAEERASRAALALELEKERNAAATAADEALSMILRLQEEKASIEMEARQYQRMIEEKSAFDAEEMSILKEILLRREREKHFLEKEVDTYRQMFLETEQPLPNTPDSKQPTEESQTPQQTTDSFGSEMFTNQMDSRILDYENVDSPKPGEVANDGEMKQEGEEGTLFSEPVAEFKKVGEDSGDIDCCVHDIHVVKDEDNKVQLNVPSDHVVRDLKLDRSQSVLGTSYGLPPACPQGRRIVSPNMRRNSMSAVDYERLKIESEVGLLRGRLRAVQKGRDNISFSSKEQSKSVLGDKTSRFWEARRSEPIDSSSPSSTMVKAMSMSLDLHSA